MLGVGRISRRDDRIGNGCRVFERFSIRRRTFPLRATPELTP
jgi:hypothetical protein